MKKKSFLGKAMLLAAFTALWGACNNSEDMPDDKGGVKATGNVSFTVEFNQDIEGGGVRATKSTAIPVTSWDNIKQLEFLLVDATGKVVYADATSPSVGGTAAKKTYTYTDVPVGTGYKLHVIANAGESNIEPNIGGAAVAQWNAYNVRQKNLTSLVLKHKAGTFPTFAQATQTTAGNKAFMEPAEIFYGEAAGVNVTAGATTTVPAFALKRKVSLMRVRIDAKNAEAGVVNTDAANGVKWDQDASIMIFRLPEQIGANGVVSSTAQAKHVLAIHGTNVFKTTDPASGYSTGGKILTDDFSMWRDIVVMPNGTTAGNAATANQYFIVISAKGQVGHELADGNKLTAPTTVYWSGVIKENLLPNQIREVNLTLRSGGTTIVPVTPREEGGLVIELNAPIAWDSNIVVTDMEI